MSAGTLAGGLQAIAPLFKPLDTALQWKLCSEPYWHADEPRWAVFVDVQGKVGHRWYMGYTPMLGSQIRYNVFAGEQLVACIRFCACARKLKDRERFIGWREAQRQKNLQLNINNLRFLVLPWIECKGDSAPRGSAVTQ